MVGKQVKMHLLFRGSRDGWKYKNFHKKCDNQGPTIMLIKTSLGRLCGAFTPLPWDSTSNCWKEDTSQQAFLFSLDSQTIYPIDKADSFAIYCRDTHGPMFGGGMGYFHNFTVGDVGTDLNSES